MPIRDLSDAKNVHKAMPHKVIFRGFQIVEQTCQNNSEISRGQWPCGGKGAETKCVLTYSSLSSHVGNLPES